MVKILVINGGSSSLKYTLDMADESVLFEGIIDRIGLSGSTHSFGSGEEGAR
jgi:acetate kinase